MTCHPAPLRNAAQTPTRTSASMRGRSKSCVGCLAEQDLGRRRWGDFFHPRMGIRNPQEKKPVGLSWWASWLFHMQKLGVHHDSSWFIMIKFHKNSNKNRWTYPTVDKSLVIFHDIHVSILSFAEHVCWLSWEFQRKKVGDYSATLDI